MSLFRRKRGGEDVRDERPPARLDRAADAREPEPAPKPEPERENVHLDEEERSPGAIVTPVAGEIVAGLTEIGIIPGDAVSGPILLEWSSEGTSWQRVGGEERAEEVGLFCWDTTSLADGPYLLRLVAVSSTGTEIAGEPVPVLIDNLGPEIRLPGPLEGRTLSGFVTIGVEAEDVVSDVSSVELEISDSGDDWRRVAEARREPFELRWSSEALRDGRYRLRIRARDGSGNVSLVGPLEVEIVNAPVAAELVDPGELLRGRINLIARTPDLRSTQMIFELAKAGSSDWRALGTTRAPFHLPIDTTQLADGSYELRIESVSVEGESVYSRRFGPYIVDNTPPLVTIAKPAPGETLRGRAELVVEVADEVSGPALVELSYNDGDKWMSLAGLEPEAGKVRGYWQVTQCRPGDCRLRATAFDRAGNEASEEITVTIAATAPESEQASVPMPVPPAQARVTAPPHPPLPVAANRFGQVPSWDWKRHHSSGAEQTDTPVKGSPDEEQTATSGAEPASSAGVKAELVGAPETEEPKKSAAWTWKASPPSSEPKPSEQPAPDEDSPERPRAAKEPPPEPAEEKPEPEPRVELTEEKPAQAIHLVESLPSETPAETEQEQKSASPDPSAEAGGRVVKVDFARSARGWDIWALSELVEETSGQDPAREEERRQILYHLREHTAVDGRIPPEFEDLVLEVFGDLIRDESDR
jgi:hypothetical protein